MRALFGNLPVFHDDDFVRIDNCRKAMGDDKSGAVFGSII